MRRFDRALSYPITPPDDLDQDELGRYSADPDLCPDCHQIRPSLCSFHASIRRQGFHDKPARLTMEQLEHLLKNWYAPGGLDERIGRAYGKK